MKTKKIILILLIATHLIIAVKSPVADEIQRTNHKIFFKQDVIFGEKLCDYIHHILDFINGDCGLNIALGFNSSNSEFYLNNNENTIEIPIILVVSNSAGLLIGLIFS